MLKSILEVSELLRQRKISPLELTRQCLAQIEKLNPTLNAFITVTADAALAQACNAEAEILNGGWRGPLHGVPLALKDLIDTAGVRTTAASAVFKDRIPTQDAEVVTRLKNAGAVLLGKQNLHEFAYGGSSVVSYYGAPHNAWNPAYITGGSSGGSATAVAAGLCYGAIGTDTSGSIREPAALCGVVGLKPTYGRVSADGVVPLAPSLDHVGPIARTVADTALMLQAIAGYDPKDKTSANVAVPKYFAEMNHPPQSFKIGIPRKFFYEDLDSEVATAVERALDALRKAGAHISEIEIDIPTDRSLQTAESYAYHAEYVRRSPELYQPETLRRIRKGEDITATEVEQSRRDLNKRRAEIGRVFENLDVLITPTTPIPAPALAELQQDPDLLRPRELLLLRNTHPVDVWGLPAISVPCGFTASGLPIGLQIIGPHWGEGKVLQLALAYEQTSHWYEREPALAG